MIAKSLLGGLYIREYLFMKKILKYNVLKNNVLI
jgi:hypothetical protein